MVLQNCWNFSETKFVPVSDISFRGMPYLANITFVVVIKLSADNPSNLLMMGNLLW